MAYCRYTELSFLAHLGDFEAKQLTLNHMVTYPTKDATKPQQE